MKNQAVLVTFEVDDRVRVRAGYQEVKKRAVVGPWTTEATVHEISPTAANYYKLRWTTRGLNSEPCGEISKRWYPWTALKRMSVDVERAEEMATLQTELAAEVEIDMDQPEARTVTMRNSPELLHAALEQVIIGTRVPWGNKNNSCHVDAFLMLEISSIVAAPWRMQDRDVRRAGRCRSTGRVTNHAC